MLPLLRWMRELGSCLNHDLLLYNDPRCQEKVVRPITEAARGTFRTVQSLAAKAQIDGWPQGANYFFRTASSVCSYKSDLKYFMWLEPDAIPISPGWLDKIEAEYLAAGKPFMGAYVDVVIDGKQVPPHMSGIGVYQNPVYMIAGEAYRAVDEAWDMAARHQIVPNAHFTQLIEHAWRHNSFTNRHELTTQIRPETILFHSSKDGSLIQLLRQKMDFPATSTLAVKNETGQHGRAALLDIPGKKGGIVGSREPISCDIFIRTYPGDYGWLKYCLQAINKYAKCFRKIWIVSPQDIPFMDKPGYQWKQMNDETEDGYLAQQITKLYADVITDYQADYILHIDSDTLFTRPVTPQDFFLNDKLCWLFTPYTEVQTPWQPITEKFMGGNVKFEFMRRLPMMIPRWLYPRIREFCHKQHGIIISEYIRLQPNRAFSEFNALGAYAYKYHHDMFTWVNTLDSLPQPVFARQFHSWAGVTPEIKSEIETILHGTESTPAVLTEPNPPEPLPTSVPSQIKVLPNGIWVIEGDTHVSKWVEQQGRLDHDLNTLPFILSRIKPGDTVIDCGSFCGDHTIAYAKAVGQSGSVMAFEPNPIAYQCLKHNMEGFSNVRCIDCGLSDKEETVPLSGNNGNAAGAYVGLHQKIADVKMERLDKWDFEPNLIKIDAEGYEPRILRGAEETIQRWRPKLVIEVNEVALQRQGANRDELFAWLRQHDYTTKIMQENCAAADPMYDIFCEPIAVLEKQDTRITQKGQIIAAVTLLKNIADEGRYHRLRVMKNLSNNGLTPRWPRKKKREKR